MRAAFRLLLAGLALVSLAFTAFQLRKITAIVEDLKSGRSASAVLPALGASLQAQAAEKLMGANLAQLEADGRPAAAAPAQVLPEPVKGPILITDTNSSRGRVAETSTASGGQRRSNAVIVERNGRSYELVRGNPTGTTPQRPDAPPTARPTPKSQASQKHLAYVLLLGSAALAAVLVVAARRALLS